MPKTDLPAGKKVGFCEEKIEEKAPPMRLLL